MVIWNYRIKKNCICDLEEGEEELVILWKVYLFSLNIRYVFILMKNIDELIGFDG